MVSGEYSNHLQRAFAYSSKKLHRFSEVEFFSIEDYSYVLVRTRSSSRESVSMHPGEDERLLHGSSTSSFMNTPDFSEDEPDLLRRDSAPLRSRAGSPR
jgi:hypothetical protein